MNSILWIQTSDGIPQKIDTVAMFCPLIYKEIMEHGKGFSDDYPVLLPECVSTSIFNLVMDYCQFYHISERPEKV
jgi:S-phase kinase-associated protein 1